MYELSGRATKDGRKVFWLVLLTLGCVAGFVIAVLGLFSIISFGLGGLLIAGLLLLGVWLTPAGSNRWPK